ncbi:MAG: hypothetical protein JSS69_12095 [Acidobacteria bacterium]|nr:hypothetical protein [Acidobacteriota bacterium]MBS1866646.1 hypothetical protein [Acidobacteriota bacterium]
MIKENQAYWLRAVGLWVVLMAAETLHGLWRVKVLSVWFGDEFARDVAVFTGSLIILLITLTCIDWIPARDVKTLLLVGFTWVVLTIGFELALGRFAFHLSWGEIAEDFNLLRGRLLPLGLLFLLFSPLIAARLRGRIGTQARHAGPSRINTN